MTFPVVESTTPGSASADALSHNVTLPATINSGDLLLILFGADAQPTITWDNTTAGTWTLLASETAQAGRSAVIYYKIANGTEDSAVLSIGLSTSDQAAWIIYRISGAAAATVIEASTKASGSSTGPDTLSLSPSWGAVDTLWFSMLTIANASAVSAYPTGYTGGTVVSSTAASDKTTVASAYRQLNASSEDPSAFSLGASQGWSGWTVAVRPATLEIISISSNNTIYANSSNVIVTGDLLSNGVYAKLVYANQEILMVDYVANRSQPYFTSPSLADVFSSRIQFTDSANLQILNATSAIVATKIVSFQPPTTKTVHNVTDVTEAGNTGSIYYGQSPEIAVNDQIVFDSKSSLTYNVSLDSQGYITIDSLNTDANDSFTYRVYESTAQVWGSEGTITFIGASGTATYFSNKIKMYIRVV
jgi:hypothetical protein